MEKCTDMDGYVTASVEELRMYRIYPVRSPLDIREVRDKLDSMATRLGMGVASDVPTVNLARPNDYLVVMYNDGLKYCKLQVYRSCKSNIFRVNLVRCNVRVLAFNTTPMEWLHIRLLPAEGESSFAVLEWWLKYLESKGR